MMLVSVCSVRHRTDSEVGIRFYWRTHSRAQNTPEWRKRQTAMRGETRTKQITVWRFRHSGVFCAREWVRQ